ncbi:hypothetical protein [Motilimonas cestriensis]|uniref:hypothetical protein n=1 Tax=Motilimonas cestriensis TaxID=2742685 RepID=UPI0031F3D980
MKYPPHSAAQRLRSTNCSRGIRNAWHFYYALNLVIKVVAATSVLRCSPLGSALRVLGELCAEQVIWE